MFSSNFTARSKIILQKVIAGNLWKYNSIPLKWLSTVSRAAESKYRESYVSGPSQRPLLGLTIGQVLEKTADSHGDREAVVVVHQNIRKTFWQLFEDADKLAAGLISLGLKRGDRIGMWGPNSYEWVLTQWAAARAGLVLVNINPAYWPAELKFTLNKVGVKALVSAESFRKENYYSILNELIPELSSMGSSVVSKDIPSLEKILMISDQDHRGTIRFKDVVENANSELISQVHNLQRKIQFDEPANIQFTSGTTGNPKGATLSHHNIVNNAYFAGLRMGYHEKDHRICISVPLYHCFGCVLGNLCGVIFNAAAIYPSPVFSAREAIKSVHKERCTSLYGTPTMFVDMLNLPELSSYDLTSLSTGIMAGAPCPQEVVKAVSHNLHMKDFVVLYGMTETSPATHQCFPKDPLEVRHSSVGFPLDHTEVKIVDENGEIVPVNTPGEILTRGFSTMLGYWNDEEKTKEVITKENWTKSGDVGVLNEHGYLQIVGRAKDMLIRGGENIYPREVEELLHTHPDVVEAHVIGIPDERLGEEVCAWVRLRPDAKVTEADLKNFCEHKIAYFKIPQVWLFRDDFPKTVTGKIQKHKMREITVADLSLKQK